MIAEFGQLALCLALISATAQAVLALIGAQSHNQRLQKSSVVATCCHFSCLLIAFGLLISLYVSGDFSVANVASNSHSLMPLLYKVTGTWGNHEGSLLLWTLALAAFGVGMLLTTRAAPAGIRLTAVAMQGAIGFGFVLFLILTSNPFARIFPPALEGRDLNPLLQDPGLAFHPPLLYLGYVGLSVSFSFAVAGLAEGQINRYWAAWVRPWTLLSWVFLTAGIGLGSWWAYYELGWGGFWFWDPVENVSFAPWLVATALLHSMSAMYKRDTLKMWTVLLAILAFSLSLVGTFIVRSGLLNSVHTFASDPKRGVFILILLAVIVGMALILYAVKAGKIDKDTNFNLISREGALTFNNFILVAAAITIVFGVLYPLALELLSGRIVTVGAGYFNLTVVPMLLLTLIALGIGPLLAWKVGEGRRAFMRLRGALGATVIGCGLIVYGIEPLKFSVVMGFGAAIWLIASICSDAWRYFRSGSQFSLSFVAMSVAHLGLAVFTVGAVGASLLSADAVGLLKPKHFDQNSLDDQNSLELAGYTAFLEKVHIVNGPNYRALRANVRLNFEGGRSLTVYPERRRYIASGQETTEAAIISRPFGDLHIIILKAEDDSEGYVIRMFHKPFALWLWIGIVLMCGGGALAIWSSSKVAKQPFTKKQPSKDISS